MQYGTLYVKLIRSGNRYQASAWLSHLREPIPTLVSLTIVDPGQG